MEPVIDVHTEYEAVPDSTDFVDAISVRVDREYLLPPLSWIKTAFYSHLNGLESFSDQG